MADVMLFERAAAARQSRRPSHLREPQFVLVKPQRSLWPSMAPLRDAIATASHGDCVAFAVSLDTPIVTRLLTLATLRWHRRRAARAIRRSGAEVVAHFGVDPSFAQPLWCYELDTPASTYTDRFIRPRGSHVVLRRLAARCFGCDPALGGVMVVGKKSC